MLKKEIHKIVCRIRPCIQYLSKCTNHIPIRWIIKYRDHISLILYTLWMGGCGYWMYHLFAADVRPYSEWLYVANDPGDAYVFLIFGTIGIGFLSALTLVIMKFIYNLFLDIIDSFFSIQWHSIIKSLSYLTLLCIAFLLVNDIKMIGLTVYEQFSHLARSSRLSDVDHHSKPGRLLEMIEKQLDR